jgi:hypothetical protein
MCELQQVSINDLSEGFDFAQKIFIHLDISTNSSMGSTEHAIRPILARLSFTIWVSANYYIIWMIYDNRDVV